MFASILHVLGVKSQTEIPSKMPLTKEFRHYTQCAEEERKQGLPLQAISCTLKKKVLC